MTHIKIKDFFPRKNKEKIGRIECYVNVLMKLSSDTYLIGDQTGTCQMKLDPEWTNVLALTKEQLVEEGKCYKIWFCDIDDTNDEERAIIIRDRLNICKINWKIKVPITSMKPMTQNESANSVRYIILLKTCIVKIFNDLK